MSGELKLRRGTTFQHSSFVGAEAELTVDTDKDVPVLHDGQTPGGYPLAKEFQLSDITSLSSLNLNALADGQAFDRLAFWSGTDVGAVRIKWKADEPTANHDGVKTIDPRRCSEPNQETKELNDYYTPVAGNTGCFVVIGVWDATSGGALGDNEFDNSPVILHLLTVVGPVHVPDGNYIFNSPVNASIPFDTTLTLSPGATLIGGAYASPMLEVRSANPGSEPYKSFNLIGGSLDNSNQLFIAAEQSGTALSLVRINEVLVLNTKFYALDDYEASIAAGVGDSGITTVDCRAVTLDGLTITGQPDLGIYLSGGAEESSTDEDGGQYVVTNCHFIACDAGLSSKRRLAGVTVSNNTFYKCRNGVLLLGTTGIGPGDCHVISGNTFKFTAERTVEIRQGFGSIVDSNVFEDSGYKLDGVTQSDNPNTVRLLGATNAQVSNNLFLMKELSTYGGQTAVNLNDYTPDGFSNVVSENNTITQNTIVAYNKGEVVNTGGSANNTFLHNNHIGVGTKFEGDLLNNIVVYSDGDVVGFQRDSTNLVVNGVSIERGGRIRVVVEDEQAAVLNRRGSTGALASFYNQDIEQGFIATQDGRCESSFGAYRFFEPVPETGIQQYSFFVDSANNTLRYRDDQGDDWDVSLTERGSGADGHYVKYANGTATCRHTMKATYVSAGRLEISWDFPTPFASPSSFSWTASMQRRDPDNIVDEPVSVDVRAESQIMESAHDGTTLTLDVRNTSNPFVPGDYIWVSLTATGEWQ